MCFGYNQVVFSKPLALFQTRMIIILRKLMKKCLSTWFRIRSNCLKRGRQLLINSLRFLIILIRTWKYLRRNHEAEVQCPRKTIIFTKSQLIKGKTHMSVRVLRQYQLICKGVERKGRRVEKEEEDNKIALISTNNKVYY